MSVLLPQLMLTHEFQATSGPDHIRGRFLYMMADLAEEGDYVVSAMETVGRFFPSHMIIRGGTVVDSLGGAIDLLQAFEANCRGYDWKQTRRGEAAIKAAQQRRGWREVIGKSNACFRRGHYSQFEGLAARIAEAQSALSAAGREELAAALRG